MTAPPTTPAIAENSTGQSLAPVNGYVAVSISRVLEAMPGKPCEDCHGHEKRRVLCWHCGLMVCRYCWHHKHRCEPGHSKRECLDLKRYQRHGKQWIARLRARGAVVHGKPHTNALSQGGPARDDCKQEPTPPLAQANG